jgi:hypothetical protein
VRPGSPWRQIGSAAKEIDQDLAGVQPLFLLCGRGAELSANSCALERSLLREINETARFACATAGISIIRPGTASSMPTRIEIDALRK